MMLRRAVVASIALTASCAPVQKKEGAGASVQDTVRVSNQHPFDMAVCQSAQPVQLPQPVNPDLLLGALSALRPQVMECLVPPSSRGEAKSTRVVVKAQVSDQGGKYTVSGENLSPEGQACVQKAVEARVPLAASPKGSAAVTADAEFTHEHGRSLAVTLGTDAGSDYSGAVRLGQPQWCDCYAGFTTQVPPTLMAHVQVAKGQTTPAVTFDPVTTPEGTALATCLQQKMVALPVKAPAEELRFSRRFIHFNSLATEPSADPLPEVRFLQNELVRQQRAADTTLWFGARNSASEAYDAAVVKYQKAKDKKQQMAELIARCNQVVEADAKWAGAVEAEVKAGQQSLTLAQELKVKDAAAWTAAEAGVQQDVTRSQEELTRAQKRVEMDREACSKMK
jgi:hypothetical protein